MQAWPARIHEKIRRTCQEAFDIFSKQVSPQTSDAPAFQPIQTLRTEHRRPAVHGADRQPGHQSARAGGAGGGGGVGRDRHAPASAEDRRHRQSRPRTGPPRRRSPQQIKRRPAAQAPGRKNHQLYARADALRSFRHPPAGSQDQQAGTGHQRRLAGRGAGHRSLRRNRRQRHQRIRRVDRAEAISAPMSSAIRGMSSAWTAPRAA